MPKNTIVVIVNGAPRTGKDTFIRLCDEQLPQDTASLIVSSIDPVKAAARQLGWDGEKSEEWRRALHAIKQAWVHACDGPLEFIMGRIANSEAVHAKSQNLIVFTNVRERSEIEKLVHACTSSGKSVYTVRINRKGISFYNNPADAQDEKINYNFEIENENAPDWGKRLSLKAKKFLLDVLPA